MAGAESILESLRAALLRGEYAPRERLVEIELATDFDTSRFIVRKALVQLAAEGLVEIQPNRGARVREISVDEAIGLTEVRGALEGLVARRAAERATASDIRHLADIAANMREAVARFEVVRYSAVNAELHTTLREIAGHTPATKILEQLNAQIVQHQFVLALVPGRPSAALQEHLDIIRTVSEADPDAAERAMRIHIANVIAALDTFRDGGSASRTGIRELARKVKPTARLHSPVILPTATLRYGDESERQLLDLYLPETSTATERLPLVISIHGGAFLMGDRSWELAALPDLLAAGFAVASLDYRLSDEAVFPAAVHDVKRATAYLRATANRWSLDPEFFAVWGRSAGGYLSAMLGATNDLDSEFDIAGQDARVAAVIDWYGPCDFAAMDAQFAEVPPTGDGPPVQSHGDAGSPESKFLGAAVDESPDLVARANPITHLARARNVPPHFLAGGTNDRLVPYQQTLMLADALRARGDSVEVRILEDASHADHQFEVELGHQAIQWLLSLRVGASRA